MNDPFAAFDPLGKQKTAATTGSYATMPMPVPLAAPAAGPYNQFGSTAMPPAAPFGGGLGAASNPFGMGPPLQTMSNQPPAKVGGGGAAFMTQPGAPAFSGLGPAAPSMPMANPFGQAVASTSTNSANPFGAQPIMYDSIKNLLQPKAPADPFATNATATLPMGAPMTTTTPRPATLTTQSSTIIDFDPFSPRDSTPRLPFEQPPGMSSSSDRTGSGALADRLNKRQTQDAARSQLGFDSSAFHGATTTSKISLKNLAISDSPLTGGPKAELTRQASSPFDDTPMFLDNSDAFVGQTVSNVDDDFCPPPPASASHGAATTGWGSRTASGSSDRAQDEPCGPDEYDVTFESGRKLGVLMERVDQWGKREERRQEIAVVKLVVENGAADRVGVSVGSSVVAINGHSVGNESYTTVLDMIKTAPRPMTVRFKRGAINKDTTQGNVLTRISNGTFSVGNFTSGNATWTQKYFAYGGAKMDVLQLFVSRAAYHECVISLYEKRAVHTQIQSFRLCRDHKISPIKTKIYKGYGNLHYFSLTVPSLRFVAAKFASEDYETIKNLWTHAYDAIERKKRMGY